jgi:hypothetical protein
MLACSAAFVNSAAAADAGLRRLGAGAPVRRSTGDLSEFTGEAASQIA